MSLDLNKKLKRDRGARTFANRSFNDFREELLNHADINFSNVNTDFSEASLGGMLLDFAAIVGESITFYMDQQLNEINYETATLDSNIQKHLRRAGINTGFSSSSSVYVTFFIEVSVDQDNTQDSEFFPEEEFLPIIRKGTTLTSDNGIEFVLDENVDFRTGYESQIGEEDSNGQPLTLVLFKKGVCSSGIITEEIVSMPDDQNQFLSLTLSNENITNILSVHDEESNEYFEVEYLSQDVIFKQITDENSNFIETKLAPYRFVIEKDNTSLLTTLRFGNGDNKKLIDDILTNPSDFSLPMRGRNYIEKFSLDPNKLLETNTLGISPAGKTLTIVYKYGGGVGHNVSEGTINTVNNLQISFPNTDSSSTINEIEIFRIRESVVATNLEEATGGTNALSLEELRTQIPAALKMQSRIVNKEDLLARIFTMPSDFGRVNKALITENKFSKGMKDLYVVSKNSFGHYVNASDGLKVNLKNYLNEFRLIGDSFNIVDVPIFNFGINIVIKVKNSFSIQEVINNVKLNINSELRFNTLQIGEPLNVNNIIFVALNTEGVASVVSDITNIVVSKSSLDNFINNETQQEIEYSENHFIPAERYQDGEIFATTGSIFELKYPQFDIVVRNS